MKSQLHSFLTLVLGGSDCPFLHHDHFNPLKIGPVTHQLEVLCDLRSSRDFWRRGKVCPYLGSKNDVYYPVPTAKYFCVSVRL